MFSVSRDAIETIKTLADQAGLPRGGGLRITTDLVHRMFVMSLEEMPLHGDLVIDMEGARVFLDPTATKALENVRLDVTVDGSGSVHLTPTDSSNN